MASLGLMSITICTISHIVHSFCSLWKPSCLYKYIVWPQPTDKSLVLVVEPEVAFYTVSACNLGRARTNQSNKQSEVFIVKEISQHGSPLYTVGEEELGGHGIQQQHQDFCRSSQKVSVKKMVLKPPKISLQT